MQCNDGHVCPSNYANIVFHKVCLTSLKYKPTLSPGIIFIDAAEIFAMSTFFPFCIPKECRFIIIRIEQKRINLSQFLL